MPIPKNIKKEHIVEAIQMIDREGVPERRESTRFKLSYDGKYYPPKYVVSIANIFANGEEYSPAMFSGGEETNKFLRGMGFTIVDIEQRENNINEYILPPLDSNGRVREYNFYSDELKGKVIYEHLINNKTHRWMDINILGRMGNTNGRDSANILYYLGLRADYRGIFTGKSLDEVIEILKSKGEDFADIVRLLKVQAISIQLYENVKSDIEAQEVEEGNGIEGTKKSYFVNKYERDPNNRKKAIEIHGLNCAVCGFNFEEVYGERGKDFMEIHHIKPLSTIEGAVLIDPKTDLVPLCANCHRMIHRRKDEVLTIEQLKALIK